MEEILARKRKNRLKGAKPRAGSWEAKIRETREAMEPYAYSNPRLTVGKWLKLKAEGVEPNLADKQLASDRMKRRGKR